MLEKLALDYPLPKLMLEYRGLAKLKSTYTDKLPRMVNPATGRVHTNYAQAVAVTGRLASNDPNLQNIPVRTVEGPAHPRGLHRAPGTAHRLGRLFADRACASWRTSRSDEGLLEPSPRARTCTAPPPRRFSASPWMKSAGTAALRQGDQLRPDLRHVGVRPGAPTGLERAAAQRLHGPLLRALSRRRGIHEETREQAREQGYVETVFGRRLWLPEIKAANGAPPPGRRARRHQRADAGHGCRPDQARHDRGAGLAGPAKKRQKLIMQVHDELVLEVPQRFRGCARNCPG